MPLTLPLGRQGWRRRLFLVAGYLCGTGTCLDSCGNTEPWGRYSASGGLYDVEGKQYIYSLGGDTQSDADDAGGGVVRTHFRWSVDSSCWERLPNTPVPVGYRGTATLLQNGSAIYVFGGGDANRAATNELWRLSVPDHTWQQIENVGTPWPTTRYKHATVKLSESKMLVIGGRSGNNVRSDAWVFDADTTSWSYAGEVVDVYRQGMAFDTKRNVTWIFGGIDSSLTSRYSSLWRYDLQPRQGSSPTFVEIEYGGDRPNRRASHTLEYVTELDALIMYGGTCGDDGEVYVYDIKANSWCTMVPANTPSLRDAMLWGVRFPNLYIYGGDVICLNPGTGVYSIADVHRLNFSNPVAWDLLYEPYNERAESIQVPCDGTNAGSCRAPTNFAGSDVDQTTCALPLNLSRRSSWPSPSPQVPTSTLPLSTASLTTSSRDLAAASGAAFLNRLIASVSASMAVYWGWV